MCDFSRKGRCVIRKISCTGKAECGVRNKAEKEIQPHRYDDLFRKLSSLAPRPSVPAQVG